MEAPVNAPMAGIANEFLELLFSMPASFSWGDSGTVAMSLWLGSGERSASSTVDAVGFPPVLNLDERRSVFIISEEGDVSENNFLEEANVKPYMEGESLVQLPASMSLGFGHVQSYQIRPNNPSQQIDRAVMLDEILDYVKFLWLQVKVLSMSRLGDASAVAQFVADIPLQLIEINGDANDDSIRTKQQVWEKWSNFGTERKVAKLMEEDIGAAMQFLLSKALCIMPISLATIVYSHIQISESSTLTDPEPEAPL